MNDLVVLSKKEMNEALLLKIANFFATQADISLNELYFNTWINSYCDKDANSFTVLNNSFTFNVFLLGTWIKDEFGMEKKVMNVIYVFSTKERRTQFLQYDVDMTPLKNIAQLILAQAPKMESFEELNNYLIHLYQRNEQMLS